MKNDFDQWDRAFADFKAKHPEVSFTKFRMEKMAQDLAKGQVHPTLGRNIRGVSNWWDAGASTFSLYRRLFPITQFSKVVDYGCGSLRVGAHFVRFLEPNCYVGLELAAGLYEIGLEVIGTKLLLEKKPTLGLVGTLAVDEAIRFCADFVFSTSVAFHVHPEDLPLYHKNLLNLTGKRGATLLLDTKICEAPFRYRERAWSWPLSMYIEKLAPLKFVQAIKLADREEAGVRFSNQILAFKRE